MSENEIICWMESQRETYGRIFFSTKDIAKAVELTMYQTRGYLENLFRAGVVDSVSGDSGEPALWFLL